MGEKPAKVPGRAPGLPEPPAGTGSSGRAMWDDLMRRYEFESHEVVLLREAVRMADQLDALAAVVARDGLMAPGPGLTVRVHPAAVERRALAVALARVIAAVRLPAGDEDDPTAVRRPQRRTGVRGPYRFGGGAA